MTARGKGFFGGGVGVGGGDDNDVLAYVSEARDCVVVSTLALARFSPVAHAAQSRHASLDAACAAVLTRLHGDAATLTRLCWLAPTPPTVAALMSGATRVAELRVVGLDALRRRELGDWMLRNDGALRDVALHGGPVPRRVTADGSSIPSIADEAGCDALLGATSLFAAAAACTGLTRLALVSLQFGSAGAVRVAARLRASLNTALRELQLTDCCIDLRGLSAVARACARLPALRRIDADLGFMHDRRADDGDGFAALLAASTSLRAVHLRGRDNAPHALFDAVAASRLEEFELSLCDHRATFDALDAAALARMMARCETLTSLNVDGWHVHDFGQLFAALQLNTTLLQLEWGVSDDDDDDDDDGESRVVDHRRRDAVARLLQRNDSIRWANCHRRLSDVVLALAALDLPPLVLLEIVNRLPHAVASSGRALKINAIALVQKQRQERRRKRR
jgi:hypothetical protein